MAQKVNESSALISRCALGPRFLKAWSPGIAVIVSSVFNIRIYAGYYKLGHGNIDSLVCWER